MERRHFLKSAALLSSTSLLKVPFTGKEKKSPEAANLMTVAGPLAPDQTAMWLPHEHILSRFGVEPAEPAIYDSKAVVEDVGPYLKYIKSLGVDTIVDCTAAYFGRNAGVLKELAEVSGMNIITNTGWYGAANDRYVPEKANKMKPDQMAREWINEFENGINGTGVKPGFIKTAIDGDGLSDIDAKLVRAAAQTHAATGLSIAVHTGGNVAGAKKELEILQEENVSPEAWIWVHAQNVENPRELIEAAEKGAWISLDGIRSTYYANQEKQGNDTVMQHLEHCNALKQAGYLDQVLLSHDGSSYPPEGKVKRPFDVLITTFIPMLKAAGYSDAEINQLTRTNPAKAFQVDKRMI